MIQQWASDSAMKLGDSRILKTKLTESNDCFRNVLLTLLPKSLEFSYTKTNAVEMWKVLPRRRDAISIRFFLFTNRISPWPITRSRRGFVVLSSQYPGLSRRTLFPSLGTSGQQCVDRWANITPFGCGITICFLTLGFRARTACTDDLSWGYRQPKTRSFGLSLVHWTRTSGNGRTEIRPTLCCRTCIFCGRVVVV